MDQRFQLEKSLKQATPDESRPSTPDDISPQLSSFSSPCCNRCGCGCRNMSTRLLSYASSFDFDTLKTYGKVRSREAFAIIKKHTEARLGRPESVITPKGTNDSSKDELIKISSAGFRRLMLEAITFGSFLWDVERYANVRYHFVSQFNIVACLLFFLDSFCNNKYRFYCMCLYISECFAFIHQPLL